MMKKWLLFEKRATSRLEGKSNTLYITKMAHIKYTFFMTNMAEKQYPLRLHICLPVISDKQYRIAFKSLTVAKYKLSMTLCYYNNICLQAVLSATWK